MDHVPAMMPRRWWTMVDDPVVDRMMHHHDAMNLRRCRCRDHHAKSNQSRNQQSLHAASPFVGRAAACAQQCEKTPIVVSATIRYTCRP
ncbi:hypothetical protein [Rhodanobacter sp. L36]|uniref:hypothetical protein n=1 Tax=Rhodanobacter sp. L36 TaxID=1747221 RepID=UPI00131EB84F|nr:hypothetical protein [Rhodanobacter sp. L36]